MRLRRRSSIAGIAVVGVFALVAVAAAPAGAAGSLVKRGKGKVTAVNSGDALKVKMSGGTKTIRIASIQAPEDAGWNPRGVRECSYSTSLKYLKKLTQGKKVVLRSQSARSGSLGRPMRSVYVYNPSTKKYTDVAASMLRAGEAIYQWFPTENAHDAYYQGLTEGAARARKGMFNTARCGVGPSQGIPIKLWVQWDADSDDNRAPNGEFVVVQNQSKTSVLNLGNWILRTPAQKYFYFPTWAKVPPGGFVRVHSGKGKHTATNFYWGSSTSLFPNVTSRTTGGGAVYLLDPQTDFRSWFMWPCRTHCAGPLQGKVTISRIRYNNTPDSRSNLNEQYVVLTSRATTRLQLDGHFLRTSAWFYNFYPGAYLDPGESLTVRMGTGTNTRLDRYWNGKAGALSAGRAVELGNWNGVRVQCIRGTVNPC